MGGRDGRRGTIRLVIGGRRGLQTALARRRGRVLSGCESDCGRLVSVYRERSFAIKCVLTAEVVIRIVRKLARIRSV